MVDHHAVAFVEELAGEDDFAGVGGTDGRAGGGAEVHATMNAGELAVEGAASAERVGGGGVDRLGEGPGPFRFGCGVGEDFVFDLLVGSDLFLRCGVRLDEVWGNADCGGAVVGGGDGDLAGDVEGFAVRGSRFEGERIGAGGGFDIDSGKGVPELRRGMAGEEEQVASGEGAF